MKKYLLTLTIIALSFLSGSIFAQLSTIDHTSPSITQDLTKAVDTSSIADPLRQWSRFIVVSPNGKHLIDIIDPSQIWWFQQAENATLYLIRTIINVILSFVSLVMLILVIYEWYKVVIYANSDDDQYKKALGKLKNYAIAIAGIALSRFLISFIFSVVGTVIGP